jgi:ribonuclease HII
MRQSGIAPGPSIEIEHRLAGSSRALIAGVDEAGRGPWAGPVVAAAVIFPAAQMPEGLDDSKRLTAERRNVLHDAIVECAIVGVGIVDVCDIDRLNILQATMQAMCEAVTRLARTPDTVLVDGNRPPQLSQRTVCIVEGDQLCPSISAASIVAKVTRDRLMVDLAQKFPVYSWHTNKGYGTRCHADAIAQFGVTAHHRRSFAPIRSALAGTCAAATQSPEDTPDSL